MRKWLAIFLLAFVPLQLSWAVAASYCQHEIAAATQHFGHHSPHQHHIDNHSIADLDATADIHSDKASDTMDLDCDHCCHGYCSVMLTLSSDLPSVLSTALPTATLDEASGAHLPTRPERPQWLLLA